MRRAAVSLLTSLSVAGAACGPPQAVEAPTAPAAPSAAREPPRASSCAELCALAPSFARPATAATKRLAVPGSGGKPVVVAFLSPIAMPSYDYGRTIVELAKSATAVPFVIVVTADARDQTGNLISVFAPPEPARVVLDVGGDLARAAGTSRFPETWIVDAEQRERVRWDGAVSLPAPDLARLVEDLAKGADCDVAIDPGPIMSGPDAGACRDVYPPSPSPAKYE